MYDFFQFQDFVIKVQLQNMPPLKTKNEIEVIKNHFRKTFITPNAALSIVSIVYSNY